MTALTKLVNEIVGGMGASLPLEGTQKAAFEETVLRKLQNPSPFRMRTTLMEIINYTPGSVSPQLGGIRGTDTDDNAVDYYNKTVETGEAMDLDAVKALRFQQKTSLIRDLVGGFVSEQEQTIVLSLLKAKPWEAVRLDGAGSGMPYPMFL